MNGIELGAVASLLLAVFGSGGVLLVRATRKQIEAAARLSNANAAKVQEERDGIAIINADKLIGLMDKQIQRFETEVTRMRVEADRYELISIRDSETIARLEELLRSERSAHERAMEEERRRCDRALEELHLRIDLLTKKVDANTQNIETHGGSMEGIAAGTPVIITPVQPEETP